MARQQTLSVIYQGLFQRSGKTAAQKWLETQLEGSALPRSPWGNRLDTTKTHLEAPRNPFSDTLRSRNSPFEAKTATATPPKAVKGFSASETGVEERIAFLKPQLSPTGFRCYHALLEAAHRIAQVRGYAVGVSAVTFFCPQEIVAHALGVDRTTVWRNLPKLIELGLLDASEWKGDLYGDTRNAGYLWQVKLDPGSIFKPRLTHEEFKHPWRDLTADVEARRTAHRSVKEPMQQSLSKKDIKQVVNQILAWALPPRSQKSPLEISMTVAPQLEAVLDVPTTPRGERNEMVDLAARAIGYTLGDTNAVSLAFYRRLLWNLLRRYDRGQDDFMSVYEMILRARSDYREGFARKAGALLHSRLKTWAVWEDVRRTPPYRVGESPK
jgi:hypothetical protein